jgi:hypothetical protein
MRINAFFFSEVNLNQDLMLSEPQCQGVNLSKQGWVNLPERYSNIVDLHSSAGMCCNIPGSEYRPRPGVF